MCSTPTLARWLHQRLDRSTTQWDHLFFPPITFPCPSLACISILDLYSMGRRLLFPSSLDPGSSMRLGAGPGHSIQDVSQNLTTPWLFDFDATILYTSTFIFIYSSMWPLSDCVRPDTFVSTRIIFATRKVYRLLHLQSSPCPDISVFPSHQETSLHPSISSTASNNSLLNAIQPCRTETGFPRRPSAQHHDIL
jgi:hypothetical protein